MMEGHGVRWGAAGGVPRATGEGRFLPRRCGAGRSHPHSWENIFPDHLLHRIPPSLDNSLLHAIETIIIDWSHQIRDLLSKDSAQPLLDGLHPLPRVEFEFWDARLANLKCIHEQVTPPCHVVPGPPWLSSHRATCWPGRVIPPPPLCADPQDPRGDPDNPHKVLGSSGLGVRHLLCGVSEFLWKGLRSCSISQLNRPKVNKIVEILEKAKSCYWPALQNVYMNVTEGEPRKRRVPAARGRGVSPHTASFGEGPGSLEGAGVREHGAARRRPDGGRCVRELALSSVQG